jgi:membrane protein
MAWTTDRRVMALRQRVAAADVLVETLEGWRRHLTGRNTAVLTYYGFLSIFPLFMVGTTILGIVLDGNEELQEDIIDTAVAQIPVVGTQIKDNAGHLDTGGFLTLFIGLLITLWAAEKAFVAAQTAFDDTWEVPIDHRDNLAVRRWKAVLGIVIIGGSLIAGTALSAVATFANFPIVGRILLLLGTAAVNAVILTSMYRYLTAAAITWRMAWPGAALAGIGFTGLQVLGATIVDRFLKGASDTAGVFASVFALMAWLNLHATLSLFGVEMNGALERRRRGISGLDHPSVDERRRGTTDEQPVVAGRDDPAAVEP